MLFYFLCLIDRKVKVKSLSCVRLFATPWTIAHQASPSMGFSRQEYWSGLPFPSPRDLPHPGIEPRSPTLLADALTSEPPGKKEFPAAAVVKTVLLRAQVSIPGCHVAKRRNKEKICMF